MLTGEIRSRVDQVWNAFWAGGIANPLEVIEQITYLLFLRRLDDLHTLEERKAAATKKPMERRVFPQGKDPRKRPYEDLRWSRLKQMEPKEMYAVVSDHVFPFLRTLGGDDSTYAHHMKDARFTIPKAGTTQGRAAEPAAFYGNAADARAIRDDTANVLREIVGSMNLDNFVVRPKRRVVEKYLAAERWGTLRKAEREELASEVAPLPTTLESDGEEAKRFDLLLLRLQLAMLNTEPAFTRLRNQVRQIAGLLEDKGSIPQVKQALPLILELQTDEWWQDVTLPMLERARKDLRLLVRFIDKRKRQPIYTDFIDAMGEEREFALPGTQVDGYARFRAKAQHFLKQHEDHVAIQKLRRNKQLTPQDLTELERVFIQSGIGSADDVARAAKESEGLGLFVRSLVGLDREAAKDALGAFLDGKTHRANQIEFVNQVVDHLTEHGSMPIERLYDSPYTDYHPLGVDGLFPEAERLLLMETLQQIRGRAAG